MPILGMLPAVRRDPTGVFMHAARRFGDVAYFKIGPRRGYLITNPADIRHVLQDNARNYHKSPLYQKLRMSIGNGLLTSEDDFWLRQRRIAQPAFHRQKVAGLAGVMAQAARETADEWQSIASDGRPVDIADEMMRFTRTVVLRALLGGDLGPFTSRIDQAWVVINEYIGESFWSLGIADRFQRAKARRFEAARAVLRQAVDHVITERRRNPTESADLLSMLLAARDEETGEGMTDEQLRVEVTTFLLAGQETTSLALTWTWYLLSQHPEARRRLEDELDTVLDGRPPGVRRSREPALHAHGRGRSDAALPAGLGLLAAGAGRRHAGRVPSAAWLARVRDPVRAAPAARVLERPGDIRSRALLAGAERRSAEVRLPAVRRRTEAMHRQSVRADRGAVERGHAGAALSSLHWCRDTEWSHGR